MSKYGSLLSPPGLDCPTNLTIMLPTAAPDHQPSASAPVPPHQLPMPPFDGGDSAANKKATNVLFYNGTTGAGDTGSAGAPPNTNNNDSTFNLLRRLANSQFQSYNTALTVTVVVGCFLLLLNVLIFAGIYYQREKRVKETRQKDELVELDSQYGTGTTTTGESLGGGGGMLSGRSPSQGSEKSGHKGGGGGAGMADGGTTTLSRKGSFQSVRNFGNFNEYRCYDEKNFQQQQQLGHHHHFGSRHHLHHHSHGSLNRKYLVDVCHNASGSVVDLPPMEVYSGGGRDAADCSTGTAMSRELSVSSSHIAHSNNNIHSHHNHQNGGLQQQQLHHQHHHVCPSSRRQSMVTEGTQSDPISLQELEYETNKKTKSQNNNKKGPKKRESAFDVSESRSTDRATGTQTENCGDDREDEYPRRGHEDDEDEEEEEEEEEDDEEELEDDESPGIPDPPPPPRSILTGGILRTASSTGVDSNCSPQTSHNSGMVTISANSSSSHAGTSSTPSATKKRVQIQEISV